MGSKRNYITHGVYGLLLCMLMCTGSSCYLLRAYKLRKLNLADNARLPSVPILPAEAPFYFTNATAAPTNKSLATYLDTALAATNTAAFLVIRNDSILYERYFNGFTQTSLLPSFSVAKSYVGTLIGIAVDEGAIKSTQQPITDYLPQLLKRDKRFSAITIQHLLDMQSGIRFNETSGILKNDALQFGFSYNIVKRAKNISIEEEPGKRFQYKSINTFLLSQILRQATGQSLAAYTEAKLWKPLGAAQAATWQVDNRRDNHEVAFAGLSATARDFAKLGRLYANEGNWNGKQIISKRWVQTIANIDSMHANSGYKNQWWSRLTYLTFTDSVSAANYAAHTPYTDTVQQYKDAYKVGYRYGAFSAQGILNQVIYVNPANNVIIVRLGNFWQKPNVYADQFIYNLGESL